MQSQYYYADFASFRIYPYCAFLNTAYYKNNFEKFYLF